MAVFLPGDRKDLSSLWYSVGDQMGLGFTLFWSNIRGFFLVFRRSPEMHRHDIEQIRTPWIGFKDLR